MRHKILVWDIPTRLFHWLLVAAIAYSWYAIEILEDLKQHFMAGYCILTLLLFRIVWGIVGTYHARFINFIYPLSEVRSYFGRSSGKAKKQYLGHNPAGGVSVIAMLVFILIQISTGLFSTDDYYFGPLYGLVSDATASTITEIHHLNFNIITGLIALHILAIVLYRIVKKERLIGAMFTGRKRTMDEDQQSIASSRLVLAAIVLSVCTTAVYLLSNASIGSDESSAQYDFY
jgi:cytochrome b